MTEAQFKKYGKIKEEIKPIKDFLFWCGDRYRHTQTYKHRFRLFLKDGIWKLNKVDDHMPMKENTYELPKDLQDRILKVIEEYVDEKEKELEAI